ncbi:MAG: hypothetical protein V1820_02735 [archaeon]
MTKKRGYALRVGEYLHELWPNAILCRPDKEIPQKNGKRPDWLVLDSVDELDGRTTYRVFPVEVKQRHALDGEEQIRRATTRAVVDFYRRRPDVRPAVTEILRGSWELLPGYVASSESPPEGAPIQHLLVPLSYHR